jgi:hypothetical protein
MKYGDNAFSLKAIKKARKNRKRKIGILESKPSADPSRVAGKPYRYTASSFSGKPSYAKYDSDSFYDSREWLEVRYKALVKYGAKCMCCGRTRHDNVIIQVDHIKPKSKYPGMALDIDNLQVLCKECNLGKSNNDSTDWRYRNT